MKIIYNEQKRFCDIEKGEIFLLSNEVVLLKTVSFFYNNKECNAITLNTGTPICVSKTERVFPKPNTEVILKS